ncbi:VTT domain-containing protein [Candidatus Azambacteria bacterium]|nr:VTT domain-containing protein [Candidatus Azambacteria bacterium]MBI3684995.1 VTT domain-containing protein [Candidatus Azambacteria bacterium]
MESLLLHYLVLWKPLGYALLGAGMMVEGDATLFTAAFLTQQGFFDPGDMLFWTLSGALAGDIIWYYLGVRFTNAAPSSLVARFVNRLAKPFDGHLIKRLFHTIFISKFTYGIHHALLMRAGMLGITIRDYMLAAFPATILWFVIIVAIGYAFGESFLLLKHYLRFAEIALLAALILFFVLEHFISVRSKKKL